VNRDVLPVDCYALCAPNGPNTPFAFPTIFWIDVARIIVMLLGMVLIVFTPRLVLQAGVVGQKCRLAGQGVFALIVIGTEVDHIGDFAHYRLALSFIGISLMLYGVWRMRTESPPRQRFEHRTEE
jgi:hypothetical protein